MKGSLQLAVAAVFLVTGAACTRNNRNRAANDQNRDQTAMASPSPSAGTSTADNMGTMGRENQPSAGDIASNPDKYVGQHVALTSDVKSVMPNGMFQLSDNDLVVLSPGAEPGENEKVTVEGTVQTYSAPELRSKYSWFKSNGRMDAQFKNKAVIVADSIKTADGRELLSSQSRLPAGAGEPGSMNTNDVKRQKQHQQKPNQP